MTDEPGWLARAYGVADFEHGDLERAYQARLVLGFSVVAAAVAVFFAGHYYVSLRFAPAAIVLLLVAVGNLLVPLTLRTTGRAVAAGHLLARVAREAPAPVEVDLSAIAREIGEQLRSRASGRKVDLVVAPGLMARADPGLLRLVLTHLLENAYKFTQGRDPAHIQVGGMQTAKNEDVYFVRDNGVGFDMAFVNTLFKPFARLHSEDEFAGTGIGLASVHMAVERLEGRTWAEGAVDRGATVYFTLPGGPPEAAREDASEASGATPNPC